VSSNLTASANHQATAHPFGASLHAGDVQARVFACRLASGFQFICRAAATACSSPSEKQKAAGAAFFRCGATRSEIVVVFQILDRFEEVLAFHCDISFLLLMAR
jgi:hypothetical protein